MTHCAIAKPHPNRPTATQSMENLTHVELIWVEKKIEVLDPLWSAGR